jgi:hypothetical protein
MGRKQPQKGTKGLGAVKISEINSSVCGLAYLWGALLRNTLSPATLVSDGSGGRI